MRHPDNRLYGIKTIYPDHLGWKHLTSPREDSGNLTTLMNFPDNDKGRAVAMNIPDRHRALVYVTQPVGGFLWAIRFMGSLADGAAAAKGQSLQGSEHERHNVYRLIKIIARIDDPKRAPTPDALATKSGFCFKPNQSTLRYIARDDYDRMFEAIPWDWSAPDDRSPIRR